MRERFTEVFKEKKLIGRLTGILSIECLWNTGGDVLGATINDMVEKGTLVEVTDRRYKLG